MNIIDRLRAAREPYRTSKVFEEAMAHNALLDAEVEILMLKCELVAAEDVSRTAVAYVRAMEERLAKHAEKLS